MPVKLSLLRWKLCCKAKRASQSTKVQPLKDAEILYAGLHRLGLEPL